MTTSTTTQSTAADFDFLIGSWRVAHRRLKDRLAGSRTWVAFPGTTVVRKTLGGQGNVDDNVLERPGGAYCAMTLRVFDPQTDRWSIWWFDGRYPTSLDAPMVGRFEAGVGTFHADDTFEGRSVRVRFRWTSPEPDRPHWEQAFSIDDGVTWETNWTMDFARADR